MADTKLTQETSRTINLTPTPLSTANSAPSASTDGVKVLSRDRASYSHVLIQTTVSAGTVATDPKIWGYVSDLDEWFPLDPVYSSAQALTATTNDSVQFQGVTAFDRLYAQQVTALGGTGTVQVWVRV